MKKKPANSGAKKPTPPKADAGTPSPYELAQTAIALCHIHRKDPDSIPPTHYFAEATDLLEAAETYLAPENVEARRRGLAQFAAKFLDHPEAYVKAKQPIPFRTLLRPVEETANPKNNPKKERTYLGAITTRTGLEKAVRRYFPKQDADRILKAKAMTWEELTKLRKAQSVAVNQRAAKRVKGKSTGNNQCV